MKTEDIQQLAIDALNDLKGIDLVTFDVRKLTSITDVMIICTARSTRHAKSLAENVVIKAKEKKLSYIKMEGEREGEWIIVDLADVVVHVMTSTARDFYHLEDLWEPVHHLRDKKA
jgi:ribosome-associated protein